MRDHSDWIIVILGSQSGQIFYSAIFFTSNGRTWVQWHRQMHLKDVEIAKNKSLAKMTKILNSGYIYFVAINVKIGRQKL